MKLDEAQRVAKKHNKLDGISAKIVRILPEHIDPVTANDNGWDVEITIVSKRPAHS